jgi:ABC-2 type transport system permease protein
MKPRRVWAVARKEFLHVLRDPRSLGMAIAIPMLMLILFGFALTVDVDNVPVVVWDQCGSASSRDFIARFDGSPYFSVVGSVDGYDAIEAALDRREAMAALVVPVEFSRDIEHGHTAAVQWIVDGSDSNTAMIAIGYAEAIARIHGREIAMQELQRRGLPPIRQPLDVRQRVWFNADRESRNYIIPGLIAVIMMVIAAMLTSLTIAREWERGTMEQLISTPVKGPELIVGKLVPYFVLGSVDVLLAVLMGEFVFGVPLRGNAALVFALGAVFLAGALSMGMLISIVARNQLLASQMAMTTTFLPAFLLSGFMIPIANMPVFIQAVTYFVPARYFVSILHAIYLKGVGLEIVGLEAALLALFGTITVLAANLKFRKRLV